VATVRARRRDRGSTVRRPGSPADRALTLAPLLVALPVLSGIALSLARLWATAVPDADFLATVNNDAEAIRAGIPLYGDPDLGYTGMLYTPLLAAVVSLLFLVDLWSGWAIAIGILSSLVLLGLTAAVAYRPPGVGGAAGRALGTAEAVGLGALAWLLVACVQINGLYTGRIDQPAWALALVGLALVPVAMGMGPRARGALVLAVVLLSAGFWTRQNTVVAPVVAVLWSVVAARFGTGRGRSAAALAAALAGVNLAVLGVLALLTEGWEPYFNFIVPGRHSLGDLGPLGPALLVRYVTELLGVTALGAGLLGLLLLAVRRDAVAAKVVRTRQRLSGGSRRLRSAAVLTAIGLTGMLAIGIPYLITVGAGRPLDQGLGVVQAGCIVLTVAAAGWLAIAWAVVLERSGTAARRRRLARSALLRAPVVALCGAVALVSFLKLSALPIPGAGAGWLAARIGGAAGIGATLAALGEEAIRARRRARSSPAVLRAVTAGEHRRPRGAFTRGAHRVVSGSYRERLAGLLAVFLALDVLATLYMRQKLGGDDHYYIGMAWTLGLLCAAAYRAARVAAPGAFLAPGAVLVLLAAFALASPLPGSNAFDLSRGALARGGIGLDPGALALSLPSTGLLPVTRWGGPSDDLLAYVRTRTVYDPQSTDPRLDTPGPLYPHFDNWYGLAAAGGRPGYLIDALVRRRFDAVRPFDEDKWSEAFASGRGRFEANVIWKLNRVVDAGYGEQGRAPESFRERRSGPNRSLWLERCFGPFPLAGTALRINRGGGFWCRTSRGAALTLEDTPAPFSDVRTDAAVHTARGALGVRMAPGRRGAFAVSLEPAGGAPLWIRGERSRRGALRLRARGPGGRSAAWRLPADARVTVAFSGVLGKSSVTLRGDGRRLARLPTDGLSGGAVLRLGGTRGSRVRYDLGGLALR